jgi:ribosome maturation factor RimP
VQIRAAIYRKEGASRESISKGSISLDDCSKAYRAIMPRLELAFSGKDIYLEVTSPGVERLIKDGLEFGHYLGRGVRCYCTDISDWTGGILEFADEKGIVIKTADGEKRLEFDIIAKAKLDPSEEA